MASQIGFEPTAFRLGGEPSIQLRYWDLWKIKHLDLDAPADLIIEAFGEEYLNKWRQMFPLLFDEKKIQHKSKDSYPA